MSSKKKKISIQFNNNNLNNTKETEALKESRKIKNETLNEVSEKFNLYRNGSEPIKPNGTLNKKANNFWFPDHKNCKNCKGYKYKKDKNGKFTICETIQNNKRNGKSTKEKEPIKPRNGKSTKEKEPIKPRKTLALILKNNIRPNNVGNKPASASAASASAASASAASASAASASNRKPTKKWGNYSNNNNNNKNK